MEQNPHEIIPSLGVLQAFVAAVRLGSVTAAAAELHLTHSAPGVACRLVAAGGPVAFARGRIDLAVRRNDFPLAPGAHVADLMPERIGPVCHPALAERLVDEPASWDVTLLHTATRPDAWTRWAHRRSPAATAARAAPRALLPDAPGCGGRDRRGDRLRGDGARRPRERHARCPVRLRRRRHAVPDPQRSSARAQRP